MKCGEKPSRNPRNRPSHRGKAMKGNLSDTTLALTGLAGAPP